MNKKNSGWDKKARFSLKLVVHSLGERERMILITTTKNEEKTFDVMFDETSIGYTCTLT